MKITFDIHGDKELMAKLDSLPRKMEKKVIRSAVRVTQKVMVPVAKANARSMVGGAMGDLIARNIQVRAARKQRRGSYVVNVQIKKGIEGLRSPTGRQHYIPAAIEYGHMAGPTYVPPIPFKRAAAESTANERMRVFREQLRIGLLREAIKNR